jgi:hypothetical protein
MLKVVRADLGTENAIRTCEEVWARGDAIHRAIIAGRAQSLQGVAVKARAAAVLVLAQLWDRPASDLDWDDEVIRKLVESISDAAAMPLPYEAIEAAPRGVPVDPIFAVIAEHRAAQEALDAAGHLPDAGDQAGWDRADHRAMAPELPMFKTEPTTIAGVAALLEYVGSDAHPGLQGGRGARQHRAVLLPRLGEQSRRHRAGPHLSAPRGRDAAQPHQSGIAHRTTLDRHETWRTP